MAERARMLTAAQFREQVDGYLKRTKTSPSAFGRSVLGDPNFVSDLRKGRIPNLQVAGKVLQVINAPSSQVSGGTAPRDGESSPGPSDQTQRLRSVDASPHREVAADADVSSLHSHSQAPPKGGVNS